MKFTEFLTEGAKKEGANLHLEHIEDEVLNRGVAGARDAIAFLRSLRDMLAGHSDTKVNVTTKWDGAPAVFAGINPDNGKFFVGTKGVFNVNPKLNYTEADIDNNHASEGLNAKLKVALRYLPKLGITGILQGDMMFAKGDLKKQSIEGESYVTFQPNTIVYAVPTDSALAKSMLSAQMGIVFHTSYTGKTFDDMKASFNIDINHLKSTKDVWFRDAYFIDASGTASFTEQETKDVTYLLSQAGTIFQKLNSMALNRISASENLLVQIKTFNNTKVRNNANELKSIFDLMNMLVDSKNMIVKKLQGMKQVTNTFLRTDDGFKITNPEGFVAVDKLKGNAVKLIDRLEFAHANFNAAKNWSK